MRPIRKITAEEENFRLEGVPGTSFGFVRRDPIEPEAVGTIVLMAFRVTGFDRDCDGSLMARLEQIDANGEATGWEANRIGLHAGTGLVVTQDEWQRLLTASAG